MRQIQLTLTLEELQLLTSLASDQLFRRQFIDPKMPGYRSRPDEVALGKSMVGRMQALIQEGRTGSHIPQLLTPAKNRGLA